MIFPFSDEVWEVFIATEVIPTYQNNIFLTVDDAVVAAKVSFIYQHSYSLTLMIILTTCLSICFNSLVNFFTSEPFKCHHDAIICHYLIHSTI